MDNDLMAYQTSCVVDNNDLGPKEIQPQHYKVHKVTYNEEMYFDAAAIIRYFTEFHLSSDEGPQQHLIITCQILDDTMRHHSFPVDEVALTTGAYLSFLTAGHRPFFSPAKSSPPPHHKKFWQRPSSPG